MVVTDSPLKVRKQQKVCPSGGHFREQEAWPASNGTTYKSLQTIHEFDGSRLSVFLEDGDQTLRTAELSAPLAVKPQPNIECPWKVPWVAITNCAVQIVIFVLLDTKLFRVLVYTPYKKNELWRFLITAFALETEQGHVKTFAVYLGGVLAGSMATSIFQKELLIVGSSAGVYCLLLSHVPHLILNFSSLPYRYYRIISVIVLCLNDILLTTIHCVRKSNVAPKIGLAAHIAGGFCGLILGFAIFSGSRTRFLRALQLISGILYIAFVIVTITLTLK